MAKTRTRNPKPETEVETAESFDPMAVGEVAEKEGKFYDSRQANAIVHPEDDEGDLPEDHDDGSGAPYSTLEDPLDEDEDPSTAQPLGRTVAGMTEGAQAASAELKEYIRRMQNLAEEKQAVADDIKELKKEIKGKGYDTKAFDLIMKLSGMTESEKQDRRDQNSVNATYAHAVGIDEDLL
jgi:uncharacterized protein (UPF0335 family)